MGIIKVAEPPRDPNIILLFWGYLATIASGLKMTGTIFLKQLFRLEKTTTLEWPEELATYSERFKGRHFLTKRPDGQVRCTACFLCATNCPAQCIHIEAAEHPDRNIEKYPKRFEIDFLRCVMCGYCEEACPVDAIRLGPEYNWGGLKGDDWIMIKEYLMNRPELRGGIQSIKPEEDKHPTTFNSPSHDQLRSIAAHVRHDEH